jgi:FixJ family two-component response regulator
MAHDVEEIRARREVLSPREDQCPNRVIPGHLVHELDEARDVRKPK